MAAIFQEDTSAIVTLPDSGIERPRQLDGKRCACAPSLPLASPSLPPLPHILPTLWQPQ